MKKKDKVKSFKKELGDQKALNRCAAEFNIAGDPTRLKVCYLLCRHQELTVGEIAEIVGTSISAVSHILKKLKEANVVKDRRDFRNVYYSLKPSPMTEIIKNRLSSL